MPLPTPRLIVALILLGMGRADVFAENPPAKSASAQEVFFEQKIRPLLVTNCLDCHGDKKQEAGIRLDSAAGLLKAGNNGPPVIPAKPDESLLMQVVGYEADIQMPPKGKLSAEELAALRTWIEQGAVFPGDALPTGPALGALATPDGIRHSRETHWSYQPIVRPSLPQVIDATWCQSALDRFVLAQLEASQLSPSPAADRRTVIRRVTFDLIGLPPTMDEVIEFEQDPSPDAMARLTDRLLASPHYGERWGRHWLDIARYADTKGYVFTEERKYPFSYTYRDYVIRAFNQDLPFDRFVLEQLAADQVATGDDQPALAAMGFLTLGRRFGNNPHDIIDDRIDVVTRGLLGLTVTCARCHDHKFDALPIEDYYSLYGVFASSFEPPELPSIGMPASVEAYRIYEQELQTRRTAVDQYYDAAEHEFRDELRTHVGDALAAVLNLEPLPNRPEVKPKIKQRWQEYLASTANDFHPVFGAWQALSQLPADNYLERAAAIIAELNDAADAQPRTNRFVKQALQTAKPADKAALAKIYGDLFADVQAEWVKMRTTHTTSLPDPQREELRQVLYAAGTPTDLSGDEARKLFDRAKRDKITQLKKAVEQHQLTSPGAPPRAMVMHDHPQPMQSHVFQRGNPGRPGKPVPRQFLQVLQSAPQPFQHGSGRLELAQAIVSPHNPLTARVIVNRVFQQHFGKGLVHTPSDFGIRGERPTHPELLDFLAHTFLHTGWSLKSLHRQLLLSAAYQQRSDDRTDGRRLDPDNRLWWKMNRRRLEFEPLRDSLLASSNQLDDRMYGRPVDLFHAPVSAQRAVYGFIDRQDLPGTFRVFDFASPDVSTAQRAETTIPQQLLFGMNSLLVIEQSRHLAQRVLQEQGSETIAQVRRSYQLAYSRSATDDEVSLATTFLEEAARLKSNDPAVLSPLEQLAQALLLSNEFVFID